MQYFWIVFNWWLFHYLWFKKKRLLRWVSVSWCISYSVPFSHSVMSNLFRPHGLQHARLPCPSPTPRAYSNSCPSSRWRHYKSMRTEKNNVKCNTKKNKHSTEPFQINTQIQVIWHKIKSFQLMSAIKQNFMEKSQSPYLGLLLS